MHHLLLLRHPLLRYFDAADLRNLRDRGEYFKPGAAPSHDAPSVSKEAVDTWAEILQLK